MDYKIIQNRSVLTKRKGVGMIRSEIDLNNGQNINETHTFHFVLISKDIYPFYHFSNYFPYLHVR